ncbi:RNA polymerase subunit sigma-24 [Sphingomonas panacis]|uniref:RNA polymerase subunit sigma-24 n=1 Tax=Sphingomonas panacis TaxID=1560345 RepID=A0A1B3ZDZ4_9SPHN|nr:RNA polymerase sigma factor [Sphingomonas panacis]AOH85632.1 RNA polymerase subunit sigma-24 [Sphingomonas panacis]
MSPPIANRGLPGEPSEPIVVSCGEDSNEARAPFDLDGMYREQAPRLTRFFRRQLREHDEPQDLVQEAFARLASFMSRETLSNPAPYLQRIARNLLFERTRRRKSRMAAFHVPIGEGMDPAIGPDQAHRIEAEDVMRVYRQALAELPEKTRTVFLLHRVDELTYKEIGERLGISVPTVQYHVARALAHIDAALEQE